MISRVEFSTCKKQANIELVEVWFFSVSLHFFSSFQINTLYVEGMKIARKIKYEIPRNSIWQSVFWGFVGTRRLH